MSEIVKYVLDNGVRLLIEPVGHVKSVAIGLWCKTGSGHEFDGEAGITHLIEHMLFKGTPTRSAKEIAEAIEGRGGSLNAFTDKESTCYYCRSLSEDAEHGIDVLTDMMLHSVLDPDELSREQGVVIEEIKRSEDEPSDNVHDLHLQQLWPHHPLGRPIIGTPESVGSFKRDDLTTYMERRYRAENVVLSVTGNVDIRKIREGAERALGSILSGGKTEEQPKPASSGCSKMINKDVEQVHFCIGGDAVSIYDEDLHTVGVMDNAMGGGMSSRLFQEIREKRGLAYAIGSYTLSYAAGGAYTVYGGASRENWPLVQELVRTEFDKIMQDGFGAEELTRTKKNIAGNLVLALEGMSGRMMRMSRNEIYHGREISIEETLEKVDKVSNDDLIAFARRTLGPERIVTTAIGPLEG